MFQITDDKIYLEGECSGRFQTPNRWESLYHPRDIRPGGDGYRASSNRPVAGSKPVAQQRCLAIAGRRRDKSQLGRVYALVEALDQAGARDQVWSGGGKIEFGLQKRCGHFTTRVAEGLNWSL